MRKVPGGAQQNKTWNISRWSPGLAPSKVPVWARSKPGAAYTANNASLFIVIEEATGELAFLLTGGRDGA